MNPQWPKSHQFFLHGLRGHGGKQGRNQPTHNPPYSQHGFDWRPFSSPWGHGQHSHSTRAIWQGHMTKLMLRSSSLCKPSPCGLEAEEWTILLWLSYHWESRLFFCIGYFVCRQWVRWDLFSKLTPSSFCIWKLWSRLGMYTRDWIWIQPHSALIYLVSRIHLNTNISMVFWGDIWEPRHSEAPRQRGQGGMDPCLPNAACLAPPRGFLWWWGTPRSQGTGSTI